MHGDIGPILDGLLVRAGAGDWDRAFTELFLIARAPLEKFLHSINVFGIDEEEIRDLTMDTMESVYVKGHTYEARNGASAFTFICSIGRNKLIQAARRHQQFVKKIEPKLRDEETAKQRKGSATLRHTEEAAFSNLRFEPIISRYKDDISCFRDKLPPRERQLFDFETDGPFIEEDGTPIEKYTKLAEILGTKPNVIGNAKKSVQKKARKRFPELAWESDPKLAWDRFVEIAYVCRGLARGGDDRV